MNINQSWQEYRLLMTLPDTIEMRLSFEFGLREGLNTCLSAVTKDDLQRFHNEISTFTDLTIQGNGAVN